MKTIKLPIEENKEDKINPSNPDLGWFGKMLFITISILVISYSLFYIFAYFIIGNISLEKERRIFSDISFNQEKGKLININDFLVNKIENLENIDIYLKENKEINAYAILGGNIIITTGLLKNIKYEEELIFIIGHEMEHIKNRDVLQSLLTYIPFYLTLQFMGFDLNEQILNITHSYTNKTIELKADNGGINLVNKMRLNLNCSLNFFEKENNIFDNSLQLISDHPTNIKRIKNIKEKNENPKKKCNKFIYK